MNQTIKALAVLAILGTAAFSSAAEDPKWHYSATENASANFYGGMNHFFTLISEKGTSPIWEKDGQTVGNGGKAYYSYIGLGGTSLDTLAGVDVVNLQDGYQGYLNITVTDGTYFGILALDGAGYGDFAGRTFTLYEGTGGVLSGNGTQTGVAWEQWTGKGLRIVDSPYDDQWHPIGGWKDPYDYDVFPAGIAIVSGNRSGDQTGTVQFDSASVRTVEAVPEPFTMLLAGGGLAAAMVRRRRAKKA